MPPTSLLLLVLIAGYFLGAIPFAVIIARRHGVDILTAGSGNPGATNVKRVVGKAAGNVCFALDALKGFVAAGWPRLAFAGHDWAIVLGVFGLVGAIVGHSFSCFIGWRGGKGVATTIGGLLAVSPLVILVGIAAWVAVFYGTGYVSLASLCLGIALPIVALLLGRHPAVVVLTLLLAVLIVVRHTANIRRLLNGTEHRFERGKKRRSA